MWKTFKKIDNLYMIKGEQHESNVNIYLTDLRNVWQQNFSQETLLKTFQELNPFLDIKSDKAVSEVLEMLNNITDEMEIEIEGNDLMKINLKSKYSTFDVNFKFSLVKSDPEIFLRKITVPLIQSVRHFEEQQKMLCDLLQKKDRELEEYKQEKGEISRSDLVTEKFDENSIHLNNEKLMVNIFGKSKAFWDLFIENYGDVSDGNIFQVQKEPWNNVKRKKKAYSAKTRVKKGTGVVFKNKS